MTLRDTDILDLPDAPDFISRPPSYTLQEFIALCEKSLPYWNEQRYSKPLPLPPGAPFTLDSAVKEEENGVDGQKHKGF